MTLDSDIRIVRDLAKQYAAIAAKPIQGERRDLWRKHNSLVRTRPLVYMRWFAAWNEVPESKLVCEDPFYQTHERFLRQMIYQSAIGDDYVIEPWITQRASIVTPPEGVWGVRVNHIPSTEAGGAWKFDPPLKKLEDIEKLAPPQHVVDEEATARNVSRLQDAVGDILEVDVDRSPVYTVWHGDLSTDLAHLRGLEQAMWDMIDNPEWLRRLLAFMSDGVLRTHDQAEAAGDWRLSNHQNQAQPYSLDLADPKANSAPVNRKQLWVFVAAQEMAQVSPAMHDEFMLQHQLPIMKKFGLVAYGCCEDLTHKIDMLRQIPNLRRIAVTPWADVRKCAEQIQDQYVYSWRPSPAEMICCGFNPNYIRKTVRETMEITKEWGCHVDITLKDVQTLEGHPERLQKWVEIVRSVADEYV